MKVNYPTKCWYVAATCDELATGPVGRRLLDRDIVVWRSSRGQVGAFDDRCAHRGFPLSDGHVVDDQLICEYHGCAYAADGWCMRVPTQPDVPAPISGNSAHASRSLSYGDWRSGVEFQADAAALRMREIVAVMLAKEAGCSALRPGWATPRPSHKSNTSPDNHSERSAR
ncbi:Rieske 2Fe-2S domain-containing protein [Mycobacterium sp.]|uniref:Rieske 2Fe-2S domain-containing protein n=1 Tax=Mycobacterium sp. TaxID=1785 RepID=UPI002BD6A79E|nr:Rieske 2Fe-2S domain-containing protein [Mycobacterium sp.]HTQ17371.1 Rieske 2Fe-2S domain-containing protein [Mycobacterium sp.]